MINSGLCFIFHKIKVCLSSKPGYFKHLSHSYLGHTKSSALRGVVIWHTLSPGNQALYPWCLCGNCLYDLQF